MSSGRFPGNLQRIDVLVKESITSQERLELYEEDRIDLSGLSETTYHARHRFADEYVSEPWPATYYLGFDIRNSPFDDLRVRQAFALAVDRERLSDDLLQGFNYPATGGFVPPGLPGHSPGISLPHDPIQAGQLLEQAGYPGGQGFPGLTLACTGMNTVVEYLREQWMSNLNVEVSVTDLPWTEFLQEWRKADLFLLSWSYDYPDPDNFVRVAVRSHFPHWRHEQFDRFVDRAQRALDQQERISLYQKADRSVIQEAILIPIAYGRDHSLVKPWLKLPATGLGYWRAKEVIMEPH